MNNIMLILPHPIISYGTSSFAIGNKTGALKRFYMSFKDIYNIDMNTVHTTTTTGSNGNNGAGPYQKIGGP